MLLKDNCIRADLHPGMLPSQITSGPLLLGLGKDLGLNCYLKMLLKDNFIHADLHPGTCAV